MWMKNIGFEGKKYRTNQMRGNLQLQKIELDRTKMNEEKWKKRNIFFIYCHSSNLEPIHL